jgi:hypothetical protein
MDVVLYRTRKIDAVVRRELHRFKNEVPGKALWVIGYQQDGAGYLGDGPCNLMESTQQSLRGLAYPALASIANWTNLSGYNHLSVQQFFLDRPDYDHYWIIEDDIRFTGPWGELFDALDRSPADLLTTVLTGKAGYESWHWWPSLKPPEGETVAECHLHRCFGPFFRLSRKLLTELHAAYQRGWIGHYEALWPTLCSAAGLSLEDVGGNGPFVPPERRGRFYTNTPEHWTFFPGTFIWRPAFRDEDIVRYGKDLAGRHCLWHPVKWS